MSELDDKLRAKGLIPPKPEPKHRAPSTAPAFTDGSLHPYLTAAVAGEVQRVRDAPEGQRNKLLNDAALALGHYVTGAGLPEQLVIDALTAVAEDDEPEKIPGTIRSGLKKGKSEPKGIPEGWTPATGYVLADVSSTPGRWQPRDLTAHVDGTHVPVTPSLLKRDDGICLVYPGKVNSIIGESEAGKTWVLLIALAQELNAGHNVAMIDLEDSESGFVERLLALGVSKDVIADRNRVRYINPSGLTEADYDDLGAAIDGCTIVGIDAVTEAMSMLGLDDYRPTDVAKYLKLLPRWIADRGPGVLQVDHVVKDVDSRGRYAAGSQHKLAGIDGVQINAEPVQQFGRGITGKARLFLSKDRHGHLGKAWMPTAGRKRWLADMIIESRDNGTVWPQLAPPTERSDDFRPTVLMGRVSDALLKAAKPLSGREVCHRVTGKTQVVLQALAALVDDGFVTVEKGDRGAQLHRLVAAYGDHIEALDE